MHTRRAVAVALRRRSLESTRQNCSMLNPHAAEVVARLHDWAADHEEVIGAVWNRVIAPKGAWPRADDLTQDFFSRGHTIDVARVAANMPHALGRLEQGRVVLTVRGAQYFSASHVTLDHYVRAVALAVDRYRDKQAEPAVTRADMANLGLTGRQVAQFERVLDGERWALSKSGGNGAPVRYLLQPHAALALGMLARSRSIWRPRPTRGGSRSPIFSSLESRLDPRPHMSRRRVRELATNTRNCDSTGCIPRSARQANR